MTLFDADRPLAFMHIPKTSGLGIVQSLLEAVRPRTAMISRIDRSHFGPFDRFDTFGPGARDLLFLEPEAEDRDVDLVTGHLALSTIEAWFPRAQRVTFLREPRTRLLSHWLFWRSLTDAQLAPYGQWGELAKLSRGSLVDFLSRPELACNLDNPALRMLLWPHPLLPVDRGIEPGADDALLAEATERLARFSLVDVIENPRFGDAVESWLGRPFARQVANRTPSFARTSTERLFDHFTEQTRGEIDRLSRLDRRLWEIVAAGAFPDARAGNLADHLFAASLERYRQLPSTPPE